ncbi:MAG: 4Fe-4S binding protein [Nitrospiraceae bacterium]|nr:4Fe-4S binding protein [Nitrospiraceae bacterium]
MYFVNVNLDCCTGCGECVNICPVGVYRMGDNDKTDSYQAGECVGCMSCVEVCQEKCIEVREM